MPPSPVVPSAGKPAAPKTMSSRLLTMKFMQRGAAAEAAAAAAAASSPSSAPGSPVTPRLDTDQKRRGDENREDRSSGKRRKFSHQSPSPATPLYDQAALQAAIEEEDRKRKAAIEKRAAELGDSHWVLDGAATSTPRNASTLRIVQVGFAQIDHAGAGGREALNDDDSDNGVNYDDPFGMSSLGQASIRRFNMKTKKARKENSNEKDQSSSDSSGSDSDSDSDSSSSSDQDSPSTPGDRGRERGRGARASFDNGGSAARKRARSSISVSRGGNRRGEEERKKAQQLAGERRKKEVNLNRLSSISGGQSISRPPPSASWTCHGCGKPGHKVSDCPKKRR